MLNSLYDDSQIQHLAPVIQYALDRILQERLPSAILFHDVEDRYDLDAADAAAVVFAAREIADGRVRSFN